MTTSSTIENNILVSYPRRKLLYLGQFPLRKHARRTFCGSHQFGFVPSGSDSIKKHFPHARVVFVVRDPVARAVSRYLDNMRKVSSRQFDPKFADSFESIVTKEMEFYRSCGECITVEQIHSFCASESPFGYPVGRGLYFPYIRSFLEKRLSICVTSRELIKQDFDLEFGRICSFLDIERPKIVKPEASNSRPESTSVEIAEKTLEQLRQFYRPYNLALEDWVGRGLFDL